MTSGNDGGGLSRRDVLRLAAAVPIAPLLIKSPMAPLLLMRRSPPAAKLARGAAPADAEAIGGTLRIAKYAYPLPEFDSWFDNVLAREWGARHGVQVQVDHVPVEELAALAAAEAAARQGHDLVMFPWPPADLAPLAIDHAEVYRAASFRHGSIDRLAHRSTYDPRTKRYFAFADSYMPAPLHYFADQWAAVGMRLGPVHYGGLRSGGARLRAKLGVPVGLALTPTLEGNITLHTLLLGFGSSILDAAGNVAIARGSRAIGALRYAKLLHEEAGGGPEQLGWGPGGSARAMVARRSSASIHGIALLRTAEREDPETAARMWVCPPLVGIGGVAAVPHITSCSLVWSFAANPAAAKLFLAEMVDRSKEIYEQTRGCQFPMYQKAVPDLIVRLENDPYHGEPPYKYKEIKDALHWTANVGFPGFASPVAMETFNAHVIPRMFQTVVRGEASPEEAVRAAEAEILRIADRWKAAA